MKPSDLNPIPTILLFILSYMTYNKGDYISTTILILIGVILALTNYSRGK